MNRDQTTIHVIDDDAAICKSLRCLFESVKLPVSTYESAEAFLEVYHPTLTGCIIVDIRMPTMSGLQLLDKLKELNNSLPIIIITGYGDIAMAVRAMKAGAADFIMKPINDQNLLEIVYRGLTPSLINKKAPSSQIDLLTKREQEVVHLVAEGKSNKEIARDLSISTSTVEAHRSRIMYKFQAKNIAQLIKKYYQIA